MTQDELKQGVAREAMKYVVYDEVIGVGSGSTANFFVDELGKVKTRIAGAVASSEKTAERLKKHGIRLFDLNAVNELPVYIDGADEITEHLAMIKGGGGALTREKIVAAVAKKFVCIADESKLVPVLGKFPLPVEVIPMARGYVARQMVKLGGQPKLREGFDNLAQAVERMRVNKGLGQLTVSAPPSGPELVSSPPHATVPIASAQPSQKSSLPPRCAVSTSTRPAYVSTRAASSRTFSCEARESTG